MRKTNILLLVAFLSLFSCRFMGRRVRGNGVVKTEERSVSAFKEVEANGDLKLIVIQGDLKPVKIEGDENILPYIEVLQEGDRITIQPRNGVNLNPSGELNIYVSSPDYSSISVSGSSDIVGQNKISGSGDLALEASGSGNIEMELDAPKVTAGISGSGTIKLKGQTKDLSLDLSGVGHAYCFDLQTENTRVDISGAGSAQVSASVKLDVDVSGAGNVSYKGSPAISQEISGAGSVNKAN